MQSVRRVITMTLEIWLRGDWDPIENWFGSEMADLETEWITFKWERCIHGALVPTDKTIGWDWVAGDWHVSIQSHQENQGKPRKTGKRDTIRKIHENIFRRAAKLGKRWPRDTSSWSSGATRWRSCCSRQQLVALVGNKMEVLLKWATRWWSCSDRQQGAGVAQHTQSQQLLHLVQSGRLAGKQAAFSTSRKGFHLVIVSIGQRLHKSRLKASLVKKSEGKGGKGGGGKCEKDYSFWVFPSPDPSHQVISRVNISPTTVTIQLPLVQGGSNSPRGPFSVFKLKTCFICDLIIFASFLVLSDYVARRNGCKRKLRTLSAQKLQGGGLSSLDWNDSAEKLTDCCFTQI